MRTSTKLERVHKELAKELQKMKEKKGITKVEASKEVANMIRRWAFNLKEIKF